MAATVWPIFYLCTGLAAHLYPEPNALDSKDAISGTQYPIPSPTVLFLRPEHLKAIATDVIKEGARSWLLYPFAWRHKVSGVSEGFVTKESLWDRVLFDGARTKILGPTAATLRAVIVSGGTFPFIHPPYPFCLRFSLPALYDPCLTQLTHELPRFYVPQVLLKHL